MIQTIGLLIISNLFKTMAWYGHLKSHQHSKIWLVILVVCSIALFEYCFQVPSNRIGIIYFSLGQLKILQEIITMAVLAAFTVFYMKVPLTKIFLNASICLFFATFFIFKDHVQS